MNKSIKKYILIFLFSILSYLGLCIKNTIEIHSVFSLVLLILFFVYYSKIDLYNKEFSKDVFIFSIIFSVVYSIGSIAYDIRFNRVLSLWKDFISIKELLLVICNVFLIYGILIFIVPKISKFRIFDYSNIKSKKYFFRDILILFLCYIPYFIIFYPGILTPDSIDEIGMVMNKVPISDHHTLIHYLFMKLFYSLGFGIFHDNNIAVSFISFFQMVIMIILICKVIDFLRKRNVNQKVLNIIIFVYALFPVFPVYSITIWKDVLFGGLCLLLCIECLKLIEEKENLKMKKSISFIIVSLLFLFFRNNAIYIYLILFISSLIIFRNHTKIIITIFIIIFSWYFIIKGPVYSAIKIEKSSTSEYIAIPLQQIGRMTYKNTSFSKEEKTMIDKLIPIEELSKVYNPEIVDSIKFNNKYNADIFEENKIGYLKLWISLCLKNFDIATESYIISTLGYWYPNVDYWVSATTISNNEYGIKHVTNESVRNIVSKVFSKRIPLFGLLYNIGLYIWLVLYCIYIITKQRKYDLIYPYIPLIGMWITIMIAAPVFAEFRYLFGIVFSIPILITFPYLNINEK